VIRSGLTRLAFIGLGSCGGTGARPQPDRRPLDVESIAVIDADADGWSPSTGDCDDADESIHPSATEVGGNEVDENCDGTLIPTVTPVSKVASASFQAENTDPAPGGPRCAGDGVAFLNDVTGDGIADVALGASGCVYTERAGSAYILRGPLRGTMGPSDAVARIRSTIEPLYGGLGGMMVGDLGDLDGDGWPEIFYEAEWADALAGRLDVFSTPFSGEVMDTDSDFSIRDDSDAGEYRRIGTGVSALDGSQWALTAWAESTYSTNVYVIDGVPTAGTPDGLAAHTIWTEKNGSAGGRLAHGDFDGDGIEDLVFGWYGATNVGESGALAIIQGPVSNDAELTALATMWVGASYNEHVGESVSVPGDVDGDGLDDVLVGAFYNADIAAAAGSAYVLLGQQLDGEVYSVLDAELRVQGENTGDSFGDSVAGLGDLDGDGLPELGITASRSSAYDAPFPPARVYLIRSPVPSGVVSAASLDGALIGSYEEDIVAFPYGSSTLLAGGGDTDADGVPEFLVGSPMADGGYYEAVGRVDLIEGWPF
jgi:hypothetical protein